MPSVQSFCLARSLDRKRSFLEIALISVGGDKSADGQADAANHDEGNGRPITEGGISARWLIPFETPRCFSRNNHATIGFFHDSGRAHRKLGNDGAQPMRTNLHSSIKGSEY